MCCGYYTLNSGVEQQKIPRFRGTGLGLAIAKQLIEAQGGIIEAKNLPEGGWQVLVELKK
jgi:K+-sensing histidine kinase KdpD